MADLDWVIAIANGTIGFPSYYRQDFPDRSPRLEVYIPKGSEEFEAKDLETDICQAWCADLATRVLVPEYEEPVQCPPWVTLFPGGLKDNLQMLQNTFNGIKAILTHEADKRQRSHRAWNIPGTLDGLDVPACGDTGSQYDVVSEAFV